MKSRVVRPVVLYLAALAIMVVGHIIFMACLPGIYSSIPWSDRMAAVGAGLKIDRSIAAYLTIIPGLIAVMSIWLLPVVTDRITRAYYAIVAPIVAGAMTLDTLLYSSTGDEARHHSVLLLRLIAPPRHGKRPVVADCRRSGRMDSRECSHISHIQVIPAPHTHHRHPAGEASRRLGCPAWAPHRRPLHPHTRRLHSGHNQPLERLLLIRPATQPRRRQSALQPPLLSHPLVGIRLGMRFMEPDEAAALAAPSWPPSTYQASLADSLLRVDRPDIVLVILESFSSHLLPVQGGEPIAPCLDSIARSGLLMSNIYASSFRTDRAIPAILSGLPAAPDEPVMKHTAVAERLPGLPAALAPAGYRSIYYYGGDINFTNQRAYLLSAGIDSIVSDTDFPQPESEQMGRGRRSSPEPCDSR